MINYTLPVKIEIDDKEYEINKKGDYRMVLDVISALHDNELSDEAKSYCALAIFYDFSIPHNSATAFDELSRFIDCGENNNNLQSDRPPIMDWEKDFPVICDDINAKYGIDIRGLEYLHWWTFISYYKNIGEGQFNTIVSIRSKKQKNRKLEKWEQEFYNENRDKVDLETSVLNDEEEEFFNSIFGTE